MLAVLNFHLESVLTDTARHWQLAQEFYEGDDELLGAYTRVLEQEPDRFVFSPQAIALLMRVLIDDAREEPLRELTADERRTLQRAVLGAHSALESSLDETEWPDRSYALALSCRRRPIFHRPSYLEEMTDTMSFSGSRPTTRVCSTRARASRCANGWRAMASPPTNSGPWASASPR